MTKFIVRAYARFITYTACGGLSFTKKSPTDVPDELVAQARACDFLEEVVEEVVEKVVVEEVVDPEQVDESASLSKSKSKTGKK